MGCGGECEGVGWGSGKIGGAMEMAASETRNDRGLSAFAIPVARCILSHDRMSLRLFRCHIRLADALDGAGVRPFDTHALTHESSIPLHTSTRRQEEEAPVWQSGRTSHAAD